MTRQRIGKWTLVILTGTRIRIRKVWATGPDAEVLAIKMARGLYRNWSLFPGHLRIDSQTIRPRKAKAVRP